MSNVAHDLDPRAEESWRLVSSVDLDALNDDIEPEEKTVDVAIYYPSNLDPAHGSKVDLDLLVKGFAEAKTIFSDAGVQLKLVWVKTGHLDASLLVINSTTSGSESPTARYVNMYVEAERRPAVISREAETAFETMVGQVPDGSQIVHIVVLQDVFISFHEQLDSRTWQLKTKATGGLSFPSYMYGATMPRHLRGVITISDLTKNDDSWKTIAHEIGHKLLNVSHEYRDTSPQHEVWADGGLMLYGSGTEILAGREGRFHQERLHVSPFIYRVAQDGTREWNADYEGDGFYYDAIYDGISIDFGAPG